MSPLAWDIISKFLISSATDRLGSGESDESGNGSLAVRSHAFFEGTKWDSLHEEIAPYVPDPSKFPNPDLLRDGALPYDDWFDGEATPLIHLDKSEVRMEKSEIFISRGVSASTASSSPSQTESVRASKGLFAGSTGSVRLSAPQYNLQNQPKSVDQFLQPQEKQIFTGIVYKRVVSIRAYL